MGDSTLTIVRRQRRRGSINENAEKLFERMENPAAEKKAAPADSPSDSKSSENEDKKSFVEMRKKMAKERAERNRAAAASGKAAR